MNLSQTISDFMHKNHALTFLAVALLLLPLAGIGQEAGLLKIAKLKYDGGGDWYSNPTALPNLIEFVNDQSTVSIESVEEIVEPSGSQLFQYPYIYATGHGNISFSESEAKNLRIYLLSGGFLHIDDNYGMEKYVRREMKKVFPDIEFVELPYSHPIFSQHFSFENGLPKIHEHDGKAPQALAIIFENRVVCLFTVESDLGDGWEDASVHNDPEAIREQALKMGANVLLYALTH